MVIAGKTRTQATGMLSAPTARPPSRSTTTANVRTRASASGASASQRRAARRAAGVAARGATAASGAESVVGSRIDMSAADQLRSGRVSELRRVLARAPEASAYDEQRHPADNEQREVETGERKAALAGRGIERSLIHLVLNLTTVTAITLPCRAARTCTESGRRQREDREDR